MSPMIGSRRSPSGAPAINAPTRSGHSNSQREVAAESAGGGDAGTSGWVQTGVEEAREKSSMHG